MPAEWIIRDICSPCCVWHKPGEKEELACGGVIVIEALGPDRISPAEAGEQDRFENRFDELFDELVCSGCSFRPDGCDFRDPGFTEPALPCGGYIHLDRLLSDGIITEDDLRRALAEEK